MKLRFVLIFYVFVMGNVLGNQVDLRDFYYSVDVVMKKESSFLEEIAEFISESDIKEEVNKLQVFEKQGKPVTSMSALGDRLNKDMKTLHKNLHTLGYYNAKAKYEIKVDDENNVNVIIRVKAGNKFSLNMSIRFTDQDEMFNEQYEKTLKKQFKKSQASLPEIRNIIDTSLRMLQNVGFPYPKATKKKVFIDYQKEEALLDLQIQCGKNVNFGDTEIIAFEGINKEYIKNRLKWTPGELFNQDKIDSSIGELKNTQIFSNVKIEPSTDVTSSSLPIRVEVEEEKKHILDISLMYKGARNMNFDKSSQTSKGVKSVIAKVSWTRLNAFGNGEKLVFNAEGTPMKGAGKRADYGFELILTQPDVFKREATLEYTIAHRQELSNVYFRKNEKIGLKYMFPLTDVFFIGAGVEIETNYVDSDPIFYKHTNLSKYYDTLSIPISLIWDRTDSIMNPTSGFKLVTYGYWMKLSKSSINSLKFYGINFTYNYALDKLKNNILSFYVSRKGVLGADIDQIPVDKRLYGGGMNSVRGYAYQMAAEMVKGANVTMGGKSLLEFNTEYRRKISKEWGAVVFFDGARVYNNRPKYFEIEKKRNFFSVGAGVRYYTSIGPIRIDFAFPLHRRKGIDSRVQFIMGLGQAF